MKRLALNLVIVAALIALTIPASPFAGVALSQTQSWETKEPLPEAMADPSSVAVNGKIYTISKVDGHSPSLNYEYDPVSNTWTKKATPPTNDRYGMGSAVYDNKVYLFGGVEHGNPLSDLAIYDPATDTWTTGTNMPTASYGASATLINGKIYVVGGTSPAFGDTGGSDFLQIYDPLTDSWTTGANMPTKRQDGAATAVDNKLYVLGGYSGGTRYDVVEEYNPGTNNWTTKTPMPTVRIAMAAVASNGLIYVIGGYTNTGLTGQVEVYDPATDTWDQSYPDMPTPRAGFGDSSDAIINNVIYMVGGTDSGGASTVVEALPVQPLQSEARIAFYTDRNGDQDIYSIKPDGSDLQPIIVYPGADDYLPAVSPDGTKLAFTSDRTGNCDIWLYDFQTGSLENLTADNLGNDEYPTWSPDGSEIAFWSRRVGGDLIWKVPSSGGTATPVTTGGSDTNPDWSHNGDTIVFQSSQWSIHEVDVATGVEWETIGDFGDEYTPAYSPDDAYIAWSHWSGASTANIWIRDAGDNRWALTSGSVVDINPDWSPDGTKIVFQSNRAGIRHIFIMNADGSGTIDQITDSNYFQRGPCFYVGAPALAENPTLTVTKIVVNDDDGTAVVGDFALTINPGGISAISGVLVTLEAGVEYTVSEGGPGGYTATFGGALDSEGKVTLASGEDATGTITNDDVPPTPPCTQYTPVDSPVVLDICNVNVTFDRVTADGTTSVTTSQGNPGGPLPPNFRVRGQFVDITTTNVTYTGPITVCIGYDPGTPNPQNLKLFHQNGQNWDLVPTTVDTVNNQVCGEVDHLSWFFIGGQWVWVDGGGVPVFPSLYVGLAAAFGAAIIAYGIRRRLVR